MPDHDQKTDPSSRGGHAASTGAPAPHEMDVGGARGDVRAHRGGGRDRRAVPESDREQPEPDDRLPLRLRVGLGARWPVLRALLPCVDLRRDLRRHLRRVGVEALQVQEMGVLWGRILDLEGEVCQGRDHQGPVRPDDQGPSGTRRQQVEVQGDPPGGRAVWPYPADLYSSMWAAPFDFATLASSFSSAVYIFLPSNSASAW